jgi:hypothetical protein
MNIVKIAKAKFIGTYQLAKKYDSNIKGSNMILKNFNDNSDTSSIDNVIQGITGAYIVSNVSLTDSTDLPDNLKENLGTADTKIILMSNGQRSIYVTYNSGKKFIAILTDRSSKSNNTFMFAYHK